MIPSSNTEYTLSRKKFEELSQHLWISLKQTIKDFLNTCTFLNSTAPLIVIACGSFSQTYGIEKIIEESVKEDFKNVQVFQ